MTDDERELQRAEDRKERNADRLESDGLMFHTIFMAAAMSAGKNVGAAAREADSALEVLKSRFT